ncbi:MAG: GNAT family N-acetyltransferase [Bacteroidales bacterium]|nr:GNAT family N-acetyltransferase [Bacteroidales bacterium]
MHYHKTITLKNSATCTLRNADFADGAAVLDVFLLTHRQTDFLLSYADENTFTAEDEARYLKEKSDSPDEIEILAEIDGKVVGTAGISKIGRNFKVCHRADFGIGIDEKYWGLGIGSALTEACIECAKNAGYKQLELECIAENQKALDLYKKIGFVEFGRNPLGFNSRISGFQKLVYMRKELY